MSTFYIDQMPTCLVLKQSAFYAVINILNSLPPTLTILQSDKAKFKASLRIYFNTQSFDSVGEFSVCVCKDDAYYYFVKC
jgi:hypothetical protein